jgi:flagellar basal body-associated protein FliL
MRKLGSEKNAEEKRKRNTLILSIFMLVVLVGGTAGYAFITNPSSGDPQTQYGTEKLLIIATVG